MIDQYNPVMSGKRLKSDPGYWTIPCSRRKKSKPKTRRSPGSRIMTEIPSLRRSEFAIEPALSVVVHGVGVNLRLMDKAAFGAPQGPVLESGTSRGNALNVQVRLALETAGPLGRARRQGGHVWIGHRASVHRAGALPNSLSPETAKGGAVIHSLCTRRVPGCWSILLTDEESGRGRRFRHRPGDDPRNYPKRGDLAQ